MASSGKKRPPLVADNRYPKPGAKKPGAKSVAKSTTSKKPVTKAAAPKKATKKQAVTKKAVTKKPARKRAKTRLGRAGQFLTALIVGLITGLFRLIWRFSLRLGVIIALVVVGAVVWFAITLPPVSAQLDARALGSVTFLDRDREVFTWRGEQFGGAITALAPTWAVHLW